MRTLVLLIPLVLLALQPVSAQFVYEGLVEGFVTGGTGPDLPGTQVVRSLPFVKVTASSGETTYCDQDGAYLLDASASLVDLTVSLDGLHLTVETSAPGGTPYTEQFVGQTPGAGLDFVLNQGPVAQSDTTAQLNAVHVWNTIRQTLIDHNPVLEGYLSDTFVIRVGDPPDACCTLGEFGSSGPAPFVNLGAGGGSCGSLGNCYDATYSTAAAHEIGHYVSYQLGLLGQSTAFGEGVADALGMLIFDDSVVARSLFDTGEPLRDPASAGVMADCGVTIQHYCGQALAGMWWDLRLALGNTDTVLDLFAQWLGTTAGVTLDDISYDPNNLYVALTPFMLTEILRVDSDSDGMICNGTDHDEEIRAAFALRGIDMPDFPNIVPAEIFIRGDANNNDSLLIDDVIYLLDYLFGGGPTPPICDAADVNDDGMVGVGDPIYLLSYLFSDGPRPLWPFPEKCSDITPDNCTL